MIWNFGAIIVGRNDVIHRNRENPNPPFGTEKEMLLHIEPHLLPITCLQVTLEPKRALPRRVETRDTASVSNAAALF